MTEPATKPTRVSLLTAFFRSQITSIVATGADFLLFILLEQVLGIWYVAAAVVSAVGGGVVSYLLGRNWAFKAREERTRTQGLKYALVWVGSIALNAGGIWLLTEYLGLLPLISKVIVALVVGIGFNFVLYRWFVFTR
ncbi:MAG: GtrA family protein [Bacteroidota bacterium]